MTQPQPPKVPWDWRMWMSGLLTGLVVGYVTLGVYNLDRHWR